MESTAYQSAGAFGGGKAGGAQDPLTFIKRPNVIIRIVTLVFSLVVFGSISSEGWTYDRSQGKDVCIMNKKASVCHFATFVGVMAFIASLGLMAGEWFFEQMSSIKTRRHFVVLDLAFSSLWTLFSLLAFVIMCKAWSDTQDDFINEDTNVVGALFCAFFSILAWGCTAYMAHQRYKEGAEAAFTAGLADEDNLDEEDANNNAMAGRDFDDYGANGAGMQRF